LRSPSHEESSDEKAQGLIGSQSEGLLEVSKTVKNSYLWKTDSQLNHLAQVRYAHGDELSDLPGVTGIGMGKDHIIVYVSDETVEVPSQIEDVRIIKIRR
jgi:hypothetical protein